MIDFHILVQDNSVNFDLHIKHRITVLIGDSSTGKTALWSTLNDKDCKPRAPYPVINYSIGIEPLVQYSRDTVYVIETEVLHSDTRLGIFSKVDFVKQNIYVVLIGRAGIHRLPVPISALHKLIVVKGVTKNVPIYPEEMYDLPDKNISTIVTEDSMSGYNFMSQIHHTVSMQGAAKYKHFINSDNLLVLDSLGFGAYVSEFLDKARAYNQPYIMWKSFECFLLEEVFNMTCQADAFNLEDAYTVLLNEVTNGHYSKHVGCCGTACNSCNNTCKHYDAAKVLFKKYPKLQDLLQSISVVDEYMEAKGFSIEQRDAELIRLQSLAETSGCTIEDIVKDLL